jgi:hypothetical protein
MDEKHSLALLGLDTNAIVYEDVAGGRTRAGEKLLLRWSRAHGFLACSISTDSKSGQFKVRTPLSKNLNSGRFLGVCQDLNLRAFNVRGVFDSHTPPPTYFFSVASLLDDRTIGTLAPIASPFHHVSLRLRIRVSVDSRELV